MNKPEDYIWIKKWGEMLKSFPYYIKDQQQIAAQENAPLNAIYKNVDNSWVTTDDITSLYTRERLGIK